MPAALGLAEAIQAALARAPQIDCGLVAVNALTLARIHARLGDRDAQRASFERAFAASRGSRSLAEVIEMNALLASAESDTRSAASRLAWLRAALAWLAFDPPEGLSVGAISAVLGRHEVARTQLDQAVSEAIGDALGRAWPELGERSLETPPVFRAGAGALENARMFAGPGAAVLWTAGADTDRPYQGPRLRLVGRVVAALVDVCTAVGAAGQGRIVVDTNLGIDVPRTRAEALSVALRARATEFVFDNETIFLDEGMRPRFAADLRVSLSPMVARFDSGDERVGIDFRRRLPSTELLGDDAKLVQRIAGAAVTLGELGRELDRPIEALEEALRRLEAARILRLDLADG
jgi:hypothetical protein